MLSQLWLMFTASPTCSRNCAYKSYGNPRYTVSMEE
jgi:hypothetical protein